MNTHTRTDALRFNAALASIGKRASDGFCACACCADMKLDASDMATERDFFPKHLAALTARYEGPVCNGCANDALICDSCETCVDELLECADDINVCEACVDRVDTGDGYRNEVAT